MASWGSEHPRGCLSPPTHLEGLCIQRTGSLDVLREPQILGKLVEYLPVPTACLSLPGPWEVVPKVRSQAQAAAAPDTC